jgi:undecaprenyl diphosphate synthase
VKELHKDGIRVRFIGKRGRFSQRQQKLMQESEDLTRDNTSATLVIAVDYGGQWDITQAVQALARQVQAGSLQPEDITPELMDHNMSISELPRPDLCIRTGGDFRISNFMLWQFAYTELYFTDILWPDFTEFEFACALDEYSRRERRFGIREPDDLFAGLRYNA